MKSKSKSFTLIGIFTLTLMTSYSLSSISNVNFPDMRGYATIISPSYIEIDNQSNQTFTYEKDTTDHFNIDSNNPIPKKLEPGKQYKFDGFTDDPLVDGILHVYYNYGKDNTAQFGSYFLDDDAKKCNYTEGSSEISISCDNKAEHIIAFQITNAK